MHGCFYGSQQLRHWRLHTGNSGANRSVHRLLYWWCQCRWSLPNGFHRHRGNLSEYQNHREMWNIRDSCCHNSKLTISFKEDKSFMLLTTCQQFLLKFAANQSHHNGRFSHRDWISDGYSWPSQSSYRQRLLHLDSVCLKIEEFDV